MAGAKPFKIPFVKPVQVGNELEALREVLDRRHLAGDNQATREVESYLQAELGVRRALLTPSGTAALELAAILANLREGDEVIMPSYTFASTANAVVLRGALPVFIDVRRDTLNIDENLLPQAITDRTRAVMVVHYAGVPCAMEPINAIAKAHGLTVIEDAAQALHSRYRNRPAGALADMGAFSFHETKNVHSGEGGAFVCDEAALVHRAEIVREKGTNRAAFFRGEIDKYTWVDIGSSYLPSELGAAFLGVQLKASRAITAERLSLWRRYHEAFSNVGDDELMTPHIPFDCEHNAHIYHLRLPTLARRTHVMQRLKAEGIHAVSHYVPLHSSPAGRRFGRVAGRMDNTDHAGDGLLRLPLWPGMTMAEVDDVVTAVQRALR